MPFKDPVIAKEYRRKYYRINGKRIREYMRKHESEHLEESRVRHILRHGRHLSSWEGFIPLSTSCEMCSRDIFFNKRDRENAICFDHRHGGTEYIKGSPFTWLRDHPRNPENEKIWSSCDFGMLCSDCNRCIPTKNRKHFKNNINRYIK